MGSLNEAEAAVPLNSSSNESPNAVINVPEEDDQYNHRLADIFGIYKRQYKTSEVLGITSQKFMYLIMMALLDNLKISLWVLYQTDYNSFNMIIASFFGRKLALNIPKYEEKEGIQEEYEEIDLLPECDYPLHTALVICYVSHTMMRNAFILKGSDQELELRKYEKLKMDYEQIACDIVNILYYHDEEGIGRRKVLTALQSTYNHYSLDREFGIVIETMAVAFKAEAMKFLSQKPCLFLMDFRYIPRKDLDLKRPTLNFKFWFHAFKTVSMFVFIFCAFWFVLAVTHVGLTRSFTSTKNSFLYTITSIGKFEIFGDVEQLDKTGYLPDCSNYTRTIHYILSMDHDEASCLFRSTILPFFVFAYIFVSAFLLVNLLTAQLSKEYDEEYEKRDYYMGYLKYDELSKIEAKLLLPHPLSIIYALLHVLLFILRLVFKLLKHMRIGGWCDPCYQFLRKNTIKRMKGDPYQVVKVWSEKPEFRMDAIVKNDIKHILTVRAKSQKAETKSSRKKLFVTRSRRIFLIRKRKE